MQELLGNITKLIKPRIFVYTGLLVFIFIFYKAIMQRGCNIGYIIAFLPFITITIYLLLKNPLWSFLVLFITNYFVMGASRYVPFQAGILMDTIIIFCFTSLLIKTTYTKIKWNRVLNPLTIITSIWLLFCILELLNPKDISIENWFSKVRGIAIYPFAIVILISVLFYKYKHLKLLLFIWSILTLLGAFKGFWQKVYGFDSTETYWLYIGGGNRTHILGTGIRYFSFFTDAGNYGSSMGFSMVVFSIAAFYIKNKWLKIYFFIVALSGGYGLAISGTRGALAVPFAGYVLCVLLSKNWKTAITVTIAIISAFFILNYTTIGNSNQQMRRMRTAFDQNDPSLNVRLQNQKKLRKYMTDLPFGTSIGFYGRPVNKNDPDYRITQIPTDSWFVSVWIQTGVVGLTLHIILLTTTIVLGGYIILFKIRNKELRGLLTAMLGGTFGMIISSYGNELIGQFPNGYLFYACQTLVFMGKYYDKELEDHELLT